MPISRLPSWPQTLNCTPRADNRGATLRRIPGCPARKRTVAESASDVRGPRTYKLPERRQRRHMTTTTTTTTTAIGVDPHPASYTAAALDASTGKVLDAVTVENDREGHERLLSWAGAFPGRRWAVEGAANPFVSAFAGRLLAEGEPVTDVPPSLTSQYRSKRGRKKNDEVDAINAARASLANPELPGYDPGPHQEELKLLSRTRDRLAVELKAKRMALKAQPEGSPVRCALERVAACLAEEVKALDALLAELVEEVEPEVLEVQGVGPVLGATILAEVGDVSRFPSADRFASYCGGSPVDRSSGKKTKGRVGVNPGGNRRMNRVLHLIGRVRLRLDPRSKALFSRKRAEGKTLREAWRVLKTYIARELYRTLKALKEGRDLAPIAA